MTTLSTRLAAATQLTPELREEMARLCGWSWEKAIPVGQGSCASGWVRDKDVQWTLPKLDLTEIVAENDRRGWDSSHDTAFGQCQFRVATGCKLHRASRPDRNIQLCAMTALAMALENTNAE
jgi:hypothetical protein